MTMSMPPYLYEAVQEAQAQVAADATHALDRPARLTIYAALGSRLDHITTGGESGWRHRALLDIQAAERVLPVWFTHAPRPGRPQEEISLPQEWLQEARQALTLPPLSDRELSYTVGFTWGQAEAISSGESAGAFTCAAFAAQKALERALNDLGFDPEHANWDLTDDRTYLSYMDAAFLASCAAANGFPWDGAADATQRRAFWTWWLTEAIPTAWSSVPTDADV